MHAITPPVSTGLILVCNRCGKRMQAGGKNPSKRLVSRLKKNSRDTFERGEVRAALTSCLDICPRNRISVAIVNVGQVAAPRFFMVKADDLEATSQKILAQIRPKP